MSLPNLISLGRLFCAPLVVWLILTDELTVAFWVFFFAAASDGVDGLIAKHFDSATDLGRLLDPLADKALLVGVYAALGNAGHLDLWLVILVIFRDLLIVGGALLFWMLSRPLAMNPLVVSKINTVAQILLATVVLASLGFGIAADTVVELLVYAVAATTLASGGQYVVEWMRRAAGLEVGK